VSAQRDFERVAEMVRSGDYFKQARAWYETLYVGPIAERSFFLVIFMLAGFIGLVGFVAVMSFLPITDRPPILVRNHKLDDVVLGLSPLREKGGQVNPSLQRFFVSSYVYARESYDPKAYAKSYQFIRAQSDSTTGEAYSAQYGRENPQSPAAILGSQGQRLVHIRSVRIRDDVEPKIATVEFSTEVLGYTQPLRANWTAVLQFYYDGLVVNFNADTATDDAVMRTQDPVFRVVGYELTQAN